MGRTSRRTARLPRTDINQSQNRHRFLSILLVTMIYHQYLPQPYVTKKPCLRCFGLTAIIYTSNVFYVLSMAYGNVYKDRMSSHFYRVIILIGGIQKYFLLPAHNIFCFKMLL